LTSSIAETAVFGGKLVLLAPQDKTAGSAQEFAPDSMSLGRSAVNEVVSMINSGLNDRAISAFSP
jgi:hypothetical protein